MTDAVHDHWRMYLSAVARDLDLLSSATGFSWKVHRDTDQHYLTSPDFETLKEASNVMQAAEVLLPQIEMA